MNFGPCPLDQCLGAIIAHSQHGISKGTYLNDKHIERLRGLGVTELIVARLEADDMDENQAAEAIGHLLEGHGLVADAPHAGRVNLRAARNGLFTVEAEIIDSLNALHEGLTIATLMNHEPVTKGALVATIKIIPYALPQSIISKAHPLLHRPAMRLEAFQAKSALVVQTDSTSPKAQKAFGALKDRLDRLAISIKEHRHVPHDREALSKSFSTLPHGIDMVLALADMATIDRNDTLAAAVQHAGGTIIRHGLPVDPGNLLLLAQLQHLPTIILPGCARAAGRNGLDMILERLAANMPLNALTMAKMGVGGLLKEGVRGLPRDLNPITSGNKIIGVLLAAGSSRRMKSGHKLLAEWRGKPLISYAVDCLQKSPCASMMTIISSQTAGLSTHLPSTIKTIINPHAHQGISASIKTAIQNMDRDADGAIFMLADMPTIAPSTLTQLIEAFHNHPDALGFVPTWHGKRGNPVLWRKEAFPLLMMLEGDQGARQIMMDHAHRIVDIAVDDSGILLDVDDDDALQALQKRKD